MKLKRENNPKFCVLLVPLTDVSYIRIFVCMSLFLTVSCDLKKYF